MKRSHLRADARRDSSSLPGCTDLTLRLQKALETMQLGVTITDVAGRIVYMNAADARLHGYEPGELLGENVGILSPPHQREPLTVERLHEIGSWQRESWNVRKDGTVFPVQLLSDVVLDAEGEPIGVVTTCEDITERKRKEAALKRSNHELDSQLRQSQKLEAVGQLTGGIAHDFNNILSVILGNAELLVGLLPAESPEARTSLEDIIEAARSGATMVEQLLGFSRRAELRKAPLDLRELVGKHVDMLRRLIREDIDIRTNVARPVGAVNADASAVQQILMNLVTNARDAMPNGGLIRLEVDTAEIDADYCATNPQAAPGQYTRISVSDTGVGMDASTLARVFEPFFTTKPLGRGTGLGMAMIYGLMKQHEGHVHMYSEPGEGTVVKLYFPIVHESVKSTSGPVRCDGLLTGSETILIAEDEASLRHVAERALRKFGYDVLVAANGAEALSMFRSRGSQVDLILTDLVMPKMGGRELYEAVQRDNPNVRFLFASGYSARDVQERATLDPRIPFLRKPWSLTDLAQQVRTALDGDAV